MSNNTKRSIPFTQRENYVPLIFVPRNDIVLIRMVNVGMTKAGIVMPDSSAQGKEMVVEAIGPDVKDLDINDKVLVVGKLGQDYDFIPQSKDLFAIKQANVLLIIREKEID